MHKPQEGPRFFFNAFAAGFSGRLTRPFHHLIDVQASCALPPNGGYASSRVEGFRLKEMIHIGAAYTQVTGNAHEEEKAWNQVATSTLENVNIAGQFTASRITAVMSIRRPFDGEPTFRLHGCRFENLAVGGNELKLEFDHSFETWNSAIEKFGQPKEGVILTSAITGMRNTFDIPDFGRVILGEYMLTPYARSLSMFRLELGCGTEGDTGGGFVGGNGTRFPPP